MVDQRWIHQLGEVDAEQFITGRIALDDLVSGGFRELIDNKEENVKVLVSPKDLT